MCNDLINFYANLELDVNLFIGKHDKISNLTFIKNDIMENHGVYEKSAKLRSTGWFLNNYTDS